MTTPVQLIPIPNIPLVQPGDDLPGLIFSACRQQNLTLSGADILVIAQKIVSKAEGCLVNLSKVTPSTQAMELAERTGKPANLVEVILWDSAEIIRAKPGLLIVQHKLGFISANAGIDHSNVDGGENLVLRLPPNPDASARAIRQKLAGLAGIEAPPPVLVIDSHGRPWRLGTVGVTIGLSGLAPVQDLRGLPDLFGTPLEYTDVGFADQIAAAASLLMGQGAEGCPAVIVRGLPFTPNEQATAAEVLRSKEMDLFR